jgi:hypothetical protein
MIPVMMPGKYMIRIRNDNDILSLAYEIEIVVSPSIYSLSNNIEPTFGPKSSETLVTIHGTNLDTTSDGLYCLIGQDWVFAFEVSEFQLKCIVPTSTFSGKVNIKIANSRKEFYPGTVTFQYIDDPLIFDASPAAGSYNTELLLYGRGFLRLVDYNSLSCMFGEHETPTTIISDSQILCSVPILDSGIYSVTLRTNGQYYLRSNIEFVYNEPLQLDSIFPFNGPALRGNTVVTIYGSGFKNSIDTSCIFGSNTAPAQIISSDVLKCRVPSHRPGTVNVSLSVDGVLVNSPHQSLQYTYVADASVDKISPEFGYTSGGYFVFVFGSNFLNVTSLGCRFADMTSRGVFISNTTLVCLAPSPLGRSELSSNEVALEVTLNGIDYTDSKVLFKYSEPCDKGFFCPGMARKLFTNGTYCTQKARNFSLCEPGYFQPREGQDTCVICPIGYICPDHGLTKPVICPAGQICDIMGLRASEKSCPQGHYCLNGTKSTTLDHYNTGNWIKDYVSGVYSFNASTYDWSFKTWSLPALGQSRAQHPPEFQCDGLVCFPGTSLVVAEAPFPCPLGHYCRTGAGAMTPIPKNFSTPQRCFDGFFCPRGSPNPEGSGPCPNGYFCPTQLDAIKCPRGHYCPGVGNRSPLECYPGTYNPFETKPNCTVCPTGFICPGN